MAANIDPLLAALFWFGCPNEMLPLNQSRPDLMRSKCVPSPVISSQCYCLWMAQAVALGSEMISVSLLCVPTVASIHFLHDESIVRMRFKLEGPTCVSERD